VAKTKKDAEMKVWEEFRRKVRAEAGNVDRRDAAEMMGVTDRTLLRWHREDKGPPRKYANRSVYYRISDIEAWLRESGQRPAGNPDPLLGIHPATA